MGLFSSKPDPHVLPPPAPRPSLREQARAAAAARQVDDAEAHWNRRKGAPIVEYKVIEDKRIK
ncbi:hypothetical protein [Lentzea guizhouensis]|uniref:hypothetical protein n=1 Tax=Lentzea guizhouensis TaxID=1586287 RepID=UPI0012B6AAB8|nr:hypothetical protein [Lentzea guizhouensis]